jgi:hypothetical protein
METVEQRARELLRHEFAMSDTTRAAMRRLDSGNETDVELAAIRAITRALSSQPESEAVAWMREQAAAMRMADAREASVSEMAAYLGSYVRNDLSWASQPAPVEEASRYGSALKVKLFGVECWLPSHIAKAVEKACGPVEALEAVAWLYRFKEGGVKCVFRDFPGAFPVYDAPPAAAAVDGLAEKWRQEAKRLSSIDGCADKSFTLDTCADELTAALAGRDGNG